MNKSELLTRITTGYAELDGIIAPLNEAQLNGAGVNGDWSIKDTIAHIAAWQQSALARMRSAVQHETPAAHTLQDESDIGGIDARNARFYEENKDRSPADILADFRSSYHGIVALIPTMNDSDLFEEQQFAWMKGSALWELIAGDTYEHYDEHLPSIRDWLARAKTA
jgi:hypothetical protein